MIDVCPLDRATIADWLAVGVVGDRRADLARLVDRFAVLEGKGVVRFVARQDGVVVGRVTTRLDARPRVQFWEPVFGEGLSELLKADIAAGLIDAGCGRLPVGTLAYAEARLLADGADVVWPGALMRAGFRFVAEAAIWQRMAGAAGCGGMVVVSGDRFSVGALRELYLKCQIGTIDRADGDPIVAQRADFDDFIDPDEPTADRSLWRVALVDQTPVGLLVPQIDHGGQDSWIPYIGVGPDHRRHRVGGGLLDDCLARYATDRGVWKVMIDVINQPSIMLHRSRGFADGGGRFLTYRL